MSKNKWIVSLFTIQAISSVFSFCIFDSRIVHMNSCLQSVNMPLRRPLYSIGTYVEFKQDNKWELGLIKNWTSNPHFAYVIIWQNNRAEVEIPRKYVRPSIIMLQSGNRTRVVTRHGGKLGGKG